MDWIDPCNKVGNALWGYLRESRKFAGMAYWNQSEIRFVYVGVYRRKEESDAGNV